MQSLLSIFPPSPSAPVFHSCSLSKINLNNKKKRTVILCQRRTTSLEKKLISEFTPSYVLSYLNCTSYWYLCASQIQWMAYVGQIKYLSKIPRYLLNIKEGLNKFLVLTIFSYLIIFWKMNIHAHTHRFYHLGRKRLTVHKLQICLYQEHLYLLQEMLPNSRII